MNEWWKNPVLQGEDNDYGQYDYLVNPLPQNYREKIRGKCHCDSCGKYRCFNIRDVAFFYTLDGYDNMSYTECWLCRLSCKFYRFKRRFKNIKFF